MSLSIIFLAIPTKSGLVFTEFMHPIYSLSLGQSYHELFSLPVQDLSYSGKSIYYHFFSTRLPIFFRAISNTSLIESVFFITPLCLWVLFLTVLNLFKEQLSIKPFPYITILFFPFFWRGEGAFDTMISPYFMSVPSLSLGMSLFILCTITFLSKQNTLFILTFLLLTLTKASYSITFYFFY